MTQPYPGSGSPAPVPNSPYPAYGQSSAPGAPTPPPRREAGFFRAMFDFSFDHFITVRFSSFIYALAFIVAGLYWLLQIISGIVLGMALGVDMMTGEQGFNPVPVIIALLLGWIPSVILLIAMRLGLEFAVATVRTAQNTRRIAEAAEARR